MISLLTEQQRKCNHILTRIPELVLCSGTRHLF
jgi:hypothetical protein